ncbi:hypothetical protein BZA77DRAFT_371512 [Pyronema omphalodes]|nr:hypothetical protein BZA77DRAFT_371512 [Pyronema omphalodes]
MKTFLKKFESIYIEDHLYVFGFMALRSTEQGGLTGDYCSTYSSFCPSQIFTINRTADVQKQTSAMSCEPSSPLLSPTTFLSDNIFDLTSPCVVVDSHRVHPTTLILSLLKMTLANITNRGRRRATAPRVRVQANNASSATTTHGSSTGNAGAGARTDLAYRPAAIRQNPVDIYNLAISLLHTAHSLSSTSDEMKAAWYRPLEAVKCWGDNYEVSAGKINEVVASGSAIGKLVMKNLNIVIDVCMAQIKREVGDTVGPKVYEPDDAEEERINQLKGVTKELYCSTGDIEDEQERLKYNESTDESSDEQEEEEEEKLSDVSDSDNSSEDSRSNEEDEDDILKRMQIQDSDQTPVATEVPTVPEVPSPVMKRKAPKSNSKRAPKRRVRFQEPKKKASKRKKN